MMRDRAMNCNVSDGLFARCRHKQNKGNHYILVTFSTIRRLLKSAELAWGSLRCSTFIGVNLSRLSTWIQDFWKGVHIYFFTFNKETQRLKALKIVF